MASPNVLLVDDEPELLRGVETALSSAGFHVTTARDGPAAIQAFHQQTPDLVVLDLMLPGRDGLEVCRELRSGSDVPILILTARADDIDRILGFEIGADDYLTKPFNMRELVARIRAILRRARPTQYGETVSFDGGRLKIDFGSQEVIVDQKPISLTPTEFALLEHLVRHPGRVYTRAQLLEQVWGYDFPGDLRTVDVHVRRLRQKVETDPAHPRWIATRFGVGYLFARPQ